MCFILSLLFLVTGDGNEQANWAWLYLWRGDECVLLAHFGALVIITFSVYGVVPCRMPDVLKAVVFTSVNMSFVKFFSSRCVFETTFRFWWWVWKCTILFSLNGKRKFEQCKITHHSQWESDRIQIHSHWWDWFFSNLIINGANSLLTNCDSMLHVPLMK